MAGASDSRSELKRIAAQLEGGRKFFTEPLNELKRRLDNVFKPASLLIEQAIQHVDAAMLDYRAKQAAAAAEAQRKLDEERKKQEAAEAERQARLAAEARKAQKAGKPVSTAPVPAPAPAPLPQVTVQAPPKVVGTTSFRKVTDFEVLDPFQLPRKYLVPDETAIRKDVKAGVKEIPGVRIFEKEVAVDTAG